MFEVSVIDLRSPPARRTAQRGLVAPCKQFDAVRWASQIDPKGAGGFWRQASSRVGHDESSSLPPCSYPGAKIRSVTVASDMGGGS